MTDPQTSPGPAPDPVSPLDRVLDLALYGPVGLAVTAREGLPHWAEIGRRQVEARLTVARVVGRLAVGQGSRQGGDLVRRLAEQADGLLAALGLVPDTADEGEAGSVPERNAGSVPERNAGSVPERNAGSVPEPDIEPARSPGSGLGHRDLPPSPAAPADGDPADGDPAHLPIPGYDTLSASQVVQRLPGLSAEELDAVRRYEMAGRARQTILLKAAQLRTGP
ncbi:MAG: hypothetical protein ACR2LJ_05720 [Acidimicrobiales bacterium]